MNVRAIAESEELNLKNLPGNNVQPSHVNGKEIDERVQHVVWRTSRFRRPQDRFAGRYQSPSSCKHGLAMRKIDMMNKFSRIYT